MSRIIFTTHIGFAIFAKKSIFFKFILGLERFVDEKRESLSPFQSLVAWCARTHASLPQCSIDFPSILLSITTRTKAVSAPAESQHKHLFLWREESFAKNGYRRIRIPFHKSGELELRLRSRLHGDYVRATCVCERRFLRSMIKQHSRSRDKCHFFEQNQRRCR